MAEGRPRGIDDNAREFEIKNRERLDNRLLQRKRPLAPEDWLLLVVLLVVVVAKWLSTMTT